MHKTYVSLVVYVRDEAGYVGAFLEEVGAFLHETFELYEVIVVDDCSEDGSLEELRSTALRLDHPVTVVQLARRHGVENAMQSGLERAVGDWVFELETSRLDFELSVLSQMYEQASRGFEIVTASGDSGSTRSRLFYRVVNRYAGLETPLRTVRVRLASRRSLNAVLAMKEKVRYRMALYSFVGARQHHVHYDVRSGARRRRPRRLDRETSSLAFDIMLSFSGFGLRLAHRLSFVFGAFSALAIVYSVLVYLFLDDVVEGWTTLTVLVSGGFAGLFLVLGILGEYVARILVEVRDRPLYSMSGAEVVLPTGSAEVKPEPRFLAQQARLAGRTTYGSDDALRAPRDAAPHRTPSGD